MNARLSIFDLPTLSDTHNATSSPGSASGPTHSDAQDGQTISLCGQAAAHASLSARQAKEQGLLTSGTYGRTSTGLLKTAALQSSLASRLRARTDLTGSTLYKLTWKDRATPAGRAPYQTAPLLGAHTDSTRLQEQFSKPWLSRETPGSLTRESLERNNHVVFRMADANGGDAGSERQQHGGEQRLLP